jgi:hypothetical protein
MNSGSSYALKRARFFVIFCIIGSFLFPAQVVFAGWGGAVALWERGVFWAMKFHSWGLDDFAVRSAQLWKSVAVSPHARVQLPVLWKNIAGALKLSGYAKFPSTCIANKLAMEFHSCATGDIILSGAGTRPAARHNRFRPLRSEQDILLLRNAPHHVIEGTGAAGMLLGETETELRARYGEPAYRTYSDPETLIYTQESFNAAFVLKNDRIREIQLEIEKHKSPSLEFFTALGLHETQLKGLTSEQAGKFLGEFYRTTRLRVVGNEVDVYGRGIRFQFWERRVIRVVVYEPELYTQDFGERP